MGECEGKAAVVPISFSSSLPPSLPPSRPPYLDHFPVDDQVAVLGLYVEGKRRRKEGGRNGEKMERTMK